MTNRDAPIDSKKLLQCYWRKDYQQMAYELSLERQNQSNELPMLVTSYS